LKSKRIPASGRKEHKERSRSDEAQNKDGNELNHGPGDGSRGRRHWGTGPLGKNDRIDRWRIIC